MDTIRYRCAGCGTTKSYSPLNPLSPVYTVCATPGCQGYRVEPVPTEETEEVKETTSEKDPRLGPQQDVLRALPNDRGDRKDTPIATGVIDYFPLALAEVARLSKAGNDQHNPGQPLHWARGKSTDHADCLMRHLIERGTLDTDGISHTAKVAWRALAMLQEELEAKAGFDPNGGGADV